METLPKISVIIPAYNAQETIEECLSSVYSSDYSNYEVIVVDDNSKDGTVEKIKKLPCTLIRKDQNGGAAKSRNSGAKQATGSILVFVDSDVIIRKNTLSMFVETFNNKKDASAVQGTYSGNVRHNNFPNMYKMLFYRYGFKSVKEDFVPTIASFCAAIKKEVFDILGGFNEKMPSATTEDDEFGHRLLSKGYKILLNKEIECDHIVSLSLKDSIKRDFRMASAVAKCIFRNENDEMKRSIKNKKYCTSVGLDMTLSPFLALIIFISFIVLVFRANYATFGAFIFLMASFFLLNKNFLAFINKNSGFVFAVKSFFFTLVNTLSIGFAGILSSIEFFILKKRY